MGSWDLEAEGQIKNQHFTREGSLCEGGISRLSSPILA